MPTAQARLLRELLNRLWENYIGRVPYAAEYAAMVEIKGGRVVNDHIALRTLNTNTGEQPSGIEGLARIFLALGYEKKGTYRFIDKYLKAYHYEHPAPLLPKIFISELEVAALPRDIGKLIEEAVCDTKDPISPEHLELLANIKDDMAELDQRALIKALEKVFSRPWGAPKRSTVEAVDKVSQYGAWTLLHGNSINHFTAYINEQQVPELPDLVSTVEALKDHNIPMKNTIEGEPGSKLVQSSTQAVKERCAVIEEDGSEGKIEWTYAYYELAERNKIIDADGKEVLFTGFLGDQATNLFEMTKKD